MPLVSAIIPTFNRVDVLPRSILSILKQTFQDIELIVIDDGSTDSTADLIAGMSESIRYLRQDHKGVSAARNLGIVVSRGKLIAFLDSDDEWSQAKLEKQLELYDKADSNFICHSDELWLKHGKVVNQKNVHKKQGGRFFERALQRCLISPSAVLISRLLLDKIGLFDEELPAAEDYDLWLRITAFHSVKFVNEPLVIKHGDRSDQLSKTIPAIDRFRIQAILNILQNPELQSDYRRAAIRELVKKCEILAKGLSKHGKDEEAIRYYELSNKYQNNNY
ncbi:MAG: glycosyltransferase [Deltaproteobacteria bacterium]|nr:glycosyltransferase [Deltaproteobacteria bacterium]